MPPPGTLGRIALKQVRVPRGETPGHGDAKPTGNPMNSLVPYLDLFRRLDDAELSRLARVDSAIVADLRRQVDEIDRALERYVDLLPRLSDGELTRLTGASGKTIRFWRLCNAGAETRPATARAPARAAEPDVTRTHSAGGEATPGVPMQAPLTRTPAPMSAPGGSPAPGSTSSPAPASTPQDAPPFPGFEDRANPAPADEDDLEFALIDDDEQAITSAQSAEAEPTVSEDEDDLAFELSDDDFF